MILQQALLGSANAPLSLAQLPPQIQDCLAPATAELQLLLAAGALHLYQEAGRLPHRVTLPAPAEHDGSPLLPDSLLGLLEQCLAGQWDEIWPQWAARLQRHAYCLPPARLAAVLSRAGTAQQPLWQPLLGTRGRWLAAHQAEWAWGLHAPVGTAVDSAARWLDGAPAERVAALQQWRSSDAAAARSALASVWKTEKAEQRLDLIHTLAAGLGVDDAAFLEAALNDRSQGVRSAAARLLVRLPQSDLAQRLQQRARQWIALAPPEASPLGGGFLGKLAARLGAGPAAPALLIEPASEWDKSWSRDGLVEQAPAGEGARSFWLRQVLALIPPACWQQHTGLAPAALLQALHGSDWQEAVLRGLVDASVLFADGAWAEALAVQLSRQTETRALVAPLWPLLGSECRVTLCCAWIEVGAADLSSALAACTLPWPPVLESTVQRAARQALQEPDARNDSALELLGAAALHLPLAALQPLLPLWNDIVQRVEAGHGDWHLRYRISLFRRHLELIERRQQFDKEIPP